MRKILIDKAQMSKALGTLNIIDNKVDINDVLGVMDCCDSWLTDASLTAIRCIPTKSQLRRLQEQLPDFVSEN